MVFKVKMKAIVELSECINDSPKFREVIARHEGDLEQLEVKLDKVIKACAAMTNGGRKYAELQVSTKDVMCTASTVSIKF